MIGNSRLHWAWFVNDRLQQTWHMPHGTEPAAALASLLDNPQIPLWIASVVPSQTAHWQTRPATHIITLDRIPLRSMYPTLGLDRALAVWGAARQFGLPTLVIDAGTALTFTGADAQAHLVGGAILPGLHLQLRSLAQHTASLPLLDHQSLAIESPAKLPSRWATATPDAILSGVLYSLLATLQAFITAWLQQYPNSSIALTGGDSALLFAAWQQYVQEVISIDQRMTDRLVRSPDLIFGGMQQIARAELN